MRRRAQSGANSAILVALMALIIIIYILLLPPDMREDLLNQNSTEDDNTNNNDDLNLTLLQERPGTIQYVDAGYRNHDLPSFRIYSSEEGKVLKEYDSLYTKNSAFEKQEAKATFEVKSDDYKNFLLSFNVEKSSGTLIISLNGQEILNRELSEGSPLPIKLSQDLIQDQNTLTITVSSPGWAIWKYNEYLLKNVKITAEYIDKAYSKSDQKFFVSEEEKANLERATIFFFPRCTEQETGVLDIFVNGANVYSALADCGHQTYLPLGSQYIYQGENTIRFVTQKGSYLVDNVNLRTYIKEPTYPVYYFNIGKDFFDEVDEENPEDSVFKDKYDFILRFRFADSGKKKGTIFINGYPRDHIDTDKLTYEVGVKDYLEYGANSLEIEPETTLNIIELKVLAEEDD